MHVIALECFINSSKLKIVFNILNQQYGGHTWEIFPLPFSKIQSQPVNHRKRIHLLRPSDSSNFKLGLPRQNSKSTSQPGKAHTPYFKAMDKPVCGKTPLLEIFSHYNQVNHSPKEMAHTQFDFLVRNHKSTIQPAIWRPHMRNFFFNFFLKSKVNQSTRNSAHTIS